VCTPGMFRSKSSRSTHRTRLGRSISGASHKRRKISRSRALWRMTACCFGILATVLPMIDAYGVFWSQNNLVGRVGEHARCRCCCCCLGRVSILLCTRMEVCVYRVRQIALDSAGDTGRLFASDSADSVPFSRAEVGSCVVRLLLIRLSPRSWIRQTSVVQPTFKVCAL
jgi:hypothetical protein